jgi:hypothetical protein
MTYPEGEVGWSSWRQSASCRLSCSPITYMGEAQRTAWKAIRQGQLGQVRVVYCEVNWGRIESWHPNPGPFYEVGALFDVGVYPLTLVTTFLAPARRVVAYGKVLHPDRTTQEGVPFHIETPDWVVAAVKLAQRHGRAVDDPILRQRHGEQKGLEFHGDLGSLYLGSFQDFDGGWSFRSLARATPCPICGPRSTALTGDRRSLKSRCHGRRAPPAGKRGTGGPCRGDLPLQFVSRSSGRPVEVTSSFTPPTPMDGGNG